MARRLSPARGPRVVAALALLVAASCASSAAADDARRPFAAGAAKETCFTPGEDCEARIVAFVGEARTRVRVLSYVFTSMPIARALVAARRRGLDVEAVVDATSESPSTRAGPNVATYLRDNGIPVFVDRSVAIMHSKVVLVDGDGVLTGSYNFTASARSRNAENVLIVRGDPELARDYARHYAARRTAAKP
jgi:phosphatidylserine/phosphatidylglycerophosphate/cardiolipin synthase-like enzyme